MNLFRREVLERRQGDWLGSVQLIRPASLTVLTLFVVSGVVAVATFLSLGEYTRKARVSGYLVPDRGVVRLVAPQSATLLESHVTEGQPVRRGDVLFVLSPIDAQTQNVSIRAPLDGVITGVIAEVGQAVSPSVALASLLPAGAKLQAQLFAPSSAIGFIRPDQTVQLRYQAFPYQKFGHQSGEVMQVSRMPLQAPELASLPLQAVASHNEPLYRITVHLDRQSVIAQGQAQPLAPGMQIEADVMLERRRLIEWLFEPVLSVAGRV